MCGLGIQTVAHFDYRRVFECGRRCGDWPREDDDEDEYKDDDNKDDAKDDVAIGQETSRESLRIATISEFDERSPGRLFPLDDDANADDANDLNW